MGVFCYCSKPERTSELFASMRKKACLQIPGSGIVLSEDF